MPRRNSDKSRAGDAETQKENIEHRMICPSYVQLDVGRSMLVVRCFPPFAPWRLGVKTFSPRQRSLVSAVTERGLSQAAARLRHETPESFSTHAQRTCCELRQLALHSSSARPQFTFARRARLLPAMVLVIGPLLADNHPHGAIIPGAMEASNSREQPIRCFNPWAINS